MLYALKYGFSHISKPSHFATVLVEFKDKKQSKMFSIF